MGIEPTCSAWKADILPLNYTRRSQGTQLSVPCVLLFGDLRSRTANSLCVAGLPICSGGMDLNHRPCTHHAYRAPLWPTELPPYISRSTYYLISNQIVNSRAGHQRRHTTNGSCAACGIWAAGRPVRKEDQCMNMIVTGIPPRECRAGGYRRDDLCGSTTGGGGLEQLSYHCLHDTTSRSTKSANFQIRFILFAMISITLAFQRRAVRWLIGT